MMTTTTPPADSAKVPVKLELKINVKSETQEKVDNASDFKRVIDVAIERKQEIMTALGDGEVVGTITIGKQKIKL